MVNPSEFPPKFSIGGSSRSLSSSRSYSRAISSPATVDSTKCLQPLLEVHESEEPLEMIVPPMVHFPMPDSPKQLAVQIYQLKNVVIPDCPNKWVPKSRFITYEEDCEGFENYYGKPHVPCIPMECYNALQYIAGKTVFMNNVDYINYADLRRQVKAHAFDSDVPNLGIILARILKYKSETGKAHFNRLRRSSSSISLQLSPFSESRRRNDFSVPCNLGSITQLPLVSSPEPIVRKISAFSSIKSSLFSQLLEENTADEAVCIVVGHVPEMTVCRLAVIRFSTAAQIQEIDEGKAEPKPIKSLIFLVGPEIDMNLLDVAKALGAVISNLKFAGSLDKAYYPDQIKRFIDSYLAETVVLGPVHVDNKSLLVGDIIRKVLNKKADRPFVPLTRKMSVRPAVINSVTPVDVEKLDEKKKEKFKFFGELIEEVRNRSKHYISDFTDAWTPRIFLTSIFMFFACVSPLLTFGAILSLYTRGTIGILLSFQTQAVVGVVWCLFACQPILVPSLTGPVVIFDAALFDFCSRMDLDYLTVRLFTGLVVFLLSLISGAFNGGRLLKYVSAFIEDIFALLISLILLIETYGRLYRTYKADPPRDFNFYVHNREACQDTIDSVANMGNATMPSVLCGSRPNVFVVDLCLNVLTLAVAFSLRRMKNSRWFGSRWRNLVGDFGMVVAIFLSDAVYFLIFGNVRVDMISVPSELSESSKIARGEGIFVSPQINNWLVVPVSIGAGILAYLLVFVEVGIPETMLQRKERKLVKGGGVHWDVVLNGAIIAVSSLFGLPWMCGAAVQSVAHSQSLTVFKKSAPGESPKPEYVIEQRVTLLTISFMTWIASLLGHYVHIPYQIMFGVLAYLALMNLSGNSMIRRIGMIFKAAKNRGNDRFLEKVPFNRVRLYTIIQCICVAAVLVVKQSKHLAVLFPLVLGLFVPLHRKVLPKFFTTDELKALDGEGEEEEEPPQKEENDEDCYFHTRIPI